MEQATTEQNRDDGNPPEATLEPKRVRLRWRLILRLILVTYVGWVATLYVLQEWIIFPTDLAPAPMSKPYMAGTVVIQLEVEGGERVEAWFIPAPGCNADQPCPMVVYFHGNAELIDFQDDVVRGYHRLGYSVLLPEYRGFGRSGGNPSQDAIRSDAVRFLDVVQQRPDVEPSRVVFHGHSLGGGVAADLTTEREPLALILQSTFTSITAMANRLLVPGFLVRHPFRTDLILPRLALPVLIFHGTSDGVIPVSHGRRLSELARNATYVEYHCGHSDLPPTELDSEYWGAIEQFLIEHVPEDGKDA